MEVISRWHHLVDDFNTSTLDFYNAVARAVQAREVPDTKVWRFDISEGTVFSAKREYLRIRRRNVALDVCAAPFGKGFFFSWWLVRPGPEHPWLWHFTILSAVALWGLAFLSAVTFTFSKIAEQSSPFAGIAGRASSAAAASNAGCLVVLLLLALLPAAVVGLGLALRSGLIAGESAVMDTPFVGWLYERLFNPQTYYRHDTALMFRDTVIRAVNDVLNDLLQEQGLRSLSPEELTPSFTSLEQQSRLRL